MRRSPVAQPVRPPAGPSRPVPARATSSRGASTPQLQRTLGNRRTGRLLTAAEGGPPVQGEPGPELPAGIDDATALVTSLAAVDRTGLPSLRDAALLVPPNGWRSPGLPLQSAVREGMQARLGHPFPNVRVHTDDEAAASAKLVDALAYTAGTNVYFAPGAYDPYSPISRRLLTHELTHVIEQESSGPTRGLVQLQGGPRPADARVEDVPDPINFEDWPGYGWWLLRDDYDHVPSLEEISAAIVASNPQLAGLIDTSTPRLITPGHHHYAYYSFQHPTAGVVARAFGRNSGLRDIGGRGGPEGREVFGVYTLQLEPAGPARGRTTPTGAGQKATPAAPLRQDPLLAAYFRHFGSDPSGTPTTAINPDMKVRLALELADLTFLGEIAEAARNAIRDPTFIATTVGLIIVYVGLWLTPDPTFITKLLAAGLTLVLLASFAWQDIIGFASAFMDLIDQAHASSTEDELRVAGNRFIQTAGQVGFDILLMVAMWGAGRAFEPRIRSGAAMRARVRAESRLATARAAPGAGAEVPAPPGRAGALVRARAQAGASASPAAVLDALARQLPESARRGLADMRARAGDANTRRHVEGLETRGSDIARAMEERVRAPAERAAARAAVDQATIDLARARLIELQATRSPAARRAVHAETVKTLTQLIRAAMNGDPALRDVVARGGVVEVVRIIGETVARIFLEQQTRGVKGRSVLSNLELARRVHGFRSVAEWAAAERAAGRVPDTARMRMRGSELWQSVGEIDNAVVQVGPDGKLQILQVEETKTGTGDTGTAARAQARAALDALWSAVEGKSDVRVFDQAGRQRLGADRTAQIDPASTAKALVTARGLEGRAGFDASLPFDRPTLEEVARQFIGGRLPPGAQPAIAAPAPRKREPVPAAR